MDKVIHAEALTTFELVPDGTRVRFNVRDQQGDPASLELPSSCLNQLLMTLPHIIQQALRRNQGDGALRLVYPLGEFRLELGETDDHGLRRYLLTLQTAGPFEITFAATGNQLGGIAQAVIDEVLAPEHAVLEQVTLNS